MFTAQSLGLLVGATVTNMKTALSVTTVMMLTIMLVAGFYVRNIPVSVLDLLDESSVAFTVLSMTTVMMLTIMLVAGFYVRNIPVSVLDCLMKAVLRLLQPVCDDCDAHHHAGFYVQTSL